MVRCGVVRCGVVRCGVVLHVTSLNDVGSLVLAMKSDMALSDCRSIR